MTLTPSNETLTDYSTYCCDFTYSYDALLSPTSPSSAFCGLNTTCPVTDVNLNANSSIICPKVSEYAPLLEEHRSPFPSF